MNISSRHR